MDKTVVYLEIEIEGLPRLDDPIDEIDLEQWGALWRTYKKGERYE